MQYTSLRPALSIRETRKVFSASIGACPVKSAATSATELTLGVFVGRELVSAPLAGLDDAVQSSITAPLRLAFVAAKEVKPSLRAKACAALLAVVISFFAQEVSIAFADFTKR